MITFVSTYPPIMCGIASYTKYLCKHIEDCNVISFKLDESICIEKNYEEENTHYILSKNDYKNNYKKILKYSEDVLWFQHEFGIWPTKDFVKLIKKLKGRKKIIITFHTLHFQSKETKFGLVKKEYLLLKELLKHIDAFTVFSNGVYNSVSKAFPKFKDKMHLIRHGTHLYKQITRNKAQKRFFDYLIKNSNLGESTKKGLSKIRNNIENSKIKIIGDLGFIRPSKSEELLFTTKHALQTMMPNYKIIVLRVGTVRQEKNSKKTEVIKNIEKFADNKTSFLINTYIPEKLISIVLKSFSAIPSWPQGCTQSGRLAHAMGTGSSVVARDLEGLGETLKQAGYFTAKTYDEFLRKIRDVLISEDIRRGFIRSSIAYSKDYLFEKQAEKHIVLAKYIDREKSIKIRDR